MSQNETGKSQGVVVWVLFLGVTVAIGGNVYESMCRDQLARDLARAQGTTQQQMAKLNDTTQEALLKTQQRFDVLEHQAPSAPADTGVRQVRSELRKSNAQLVDGMEQKSQQLLGELSNLRVDTSEKLDRMSSDLASASSDVKQVQGELGAVNGLVATNAKELAAVKELGERNYLEFDLGKTKEPQKVGDLRLLLTKTDPKHNRYTVRVLADDKTVEKKDRTINEPVQLYLAGSRQPYEIVVNRVKKNEVAGYLAAPKIKLSRGQGM